MHYDIVIVGAGMVGRFLAILLAEKTNANIAIIDSNPKNININNIPDARVSAINKKSQQLLSDIDIWCDIDKKYPFTKTKVWDNQALSQLEFDNVLHSDSDNLGHIIANKNIISALIEKLNTSSTTYIQAKVLSIKHQNNSYYLTINNNKQSTMTNISCNLLIAADGANSKLRELAQIKTNTNDYQQQAIITTLSSTINLKNTIYQWFDTTGIIAILPIDDYNCALVYSCNNNTAKELLALDDKAFAKQLSKRINYYFGVLKPISARKAFPLISNIANKYVLPNFALVGDCAHSIHPLAGQGLNIGFTDAKKLADILARAGDNLADYKNLLSYQRTRQGKNELMAKSINALYYSNQYQNLPVLKNLRGFAMNMINSNNKLKKTIQNIASGM